MLNESTKTMSYAAACSSCAVSSDDSDEDDSYLKLIQFESIRNADGLEEAICVQWHRGMTKSLRLSTLLQPHELAPLFAGAQWAGTRVWHAAIAAIRYIVQNVSITAETRLLELGAGLGVPSMILHALFNCHVCVTDQESILSQLQSNIQSNFGPSPDIQARAVSWSSEEVSELLLKDEDFDIVLNCDCVYEPLYGNSWLQLIDCTEVLLKHNPTALHITSVERRAADGVDKFLNKLQQSPHVSNVDRVFEDAEYQIEIYVIRGRITPS